MHTRWEPVGDSLHDMGMHGPATGDRAELPEARGRGRGGCGVAGTHIIEQP